MPLCKYCTKLDLVEMAMREPPTEPALDSDEPYKLHDPCIEHHKDIEELLVCSFASTDRCELCEIFIVSWMVMYEWNHRDSVSSLQGQAFRVKAKKYLEMEPRICGSRIYAGYYNLGNGPSTSPGVGLWVREEDGDPDGTCIGQAMFSWKKDAVPDSNGPLHDRIVLREIHEDPKLPECIDIARNWLRDCLENHTCCISSDTKCSQLPTRVIDVGNDDRAPKLVEAGHKVGKYVALSYCWGAKHCHNVMLTTETLAAFQQGIPLSSLPNTLQDAVYVVRSLGIPYLWIDALCIIQDSTDDWVIESGRMNTIYSNATLGLFATNAESAADGFLGRRDIYAEYSVSYAQLQSHNTPCDHNINNEDCNKMILRFEHPGHGSDGYYHHSLWAKRGWTLQEGLSPPRWLSYTKLQMSWGCLTCNVSENGLGWDNELRRRENLKEYIGGNWGSATVPVLASRWNTITRLQDINLAHLPTSDLWYFVLENYQERLLSKESDRLPAIAGIAKVLESRKAETGRYFAGLWEGDLHKGLCWEVLTIAADSKHNRNCHSANEAQDIFVPSWSWASAVSSSYRRFRFQSQTCIPKSSSTQSLMTIRAPHTINDVDRFIPRRPLSLRITARCRFLSPSWYSEQASAGAQDSQQAAFEKCIRRKLGIQNQGGKWHEEGYRQGRVLEFAQKHQPWEGQRFVAVKVLEMRTRQQHAGKRFDVDYGFILILESVKDEAGLYRRVSALGLNRFGGVDFESSGLNYSEGILLQMIWGEPWPQMELQLI